MTLNVLHGLIIPQLYFRVHTGGDLFQVDSQAGDAVLKQLWHHSDAVMCCSVKMNVSTQLLHLL